MELVKCYKTSDGKVFELKSEAVKYQQVLNARQFLTAFANKHFVHEMRDAFVELFSSEKTLDEFVYGIDSAKCVLVD